MSLIIFSFLGLLALVGVVAAIASIANDGYGRPDIARRVRHAHNLDRPAR